VDARINEVDADGDEGALFAALIKDEFLDDTHIKRFKGEDDWGTLTLDAEVIEVKQQANNPPVIDLDGPGTTKVNYNVIFNRGDSPIHIAAPDAFIQDADGDDIEKLTLRLTGNAANLLSIGGVNVRPSRPIDTITVGNTEFIVQNSASGNRIDNIYITKYGGGDIPTTDLQALLASIKYVRDWSFPFTLLEDTFKIGFELDDGTNTSEEIAFSTIKTYDFQPPSHHNLFEDIVKSFVYEKDLSGNKFELIKGEKILNSYIIDFIQDDKYSEEPTGFFGMGLLPVEEGNPVFVTRGTENLKDWLSDSDPRGVGFDQFAANYDPEFDPDGNEQDIKDWLDLRSSTDKPVSFIGHSLGGALAQTIAAYYSNDNPGHVKEIVTFNSPGISDQTVSLFRGSESITHYIVDGDLVSLAGEEFLPGNSYLLSFPTTDLVPIDHKHTEKNLLDRLGSIVKVEESPIDDLSFYSFSYDDPDYLRFLSLLDLAIKSGSIVLNSPLLSLLSSDGLNSRESVETLRASLGKIIDGVEITSEHLNELWDKLLPVAAFWSQVLLDTYPPTSAISTITKILSRFNTLFGIKDGLTTQVMDSEKSSSIINLQSHLNNQVDGTHIPLAGRLDVESNEGEMSVELSRPEIIFQKGIDSFNGSSTVIDYNSNLNNDISLAQVGHIPITQIQVEQNTSSRFKDFALEFKTALSQFSRFPQEIVAKIDDLIGDSLDPIKRVIYQTLDIDPDKINNDGIVPFLGKLIQELQNPDAIFTQSVSNALSDTFGINPQNLDGELFLATLQFTIETELNDLLDESLKPLKEAIFQAIGPDSNLPMLKDFNPEDGEKNITYEDVFIKWLKRFI
jgi:hypothetical protein